MLCYLCKESVLHLQVEPLVLPYKKADGTDSFKGFLIDLLDRIGQIANFDYKFYLVPDGFFGRKVNESHWNGAIGELQSKVILSDNVNMCGSLLRNERKPLSNPDDSITQLYSKLLSQSPWIRDTTRTSRHRYHERNHHRQDDSVIRVAKSNYN